MTANTGRTTLRYVDFRVDDSAGTLRSIPINSMSVCGFVYDEMDVTAWQDAIKTALPGMPDAPIEVGGPFDTAAATTAGTLSGSHTVLYNLAGGGTPLSLDVQFGIRHTFETGEPQFGITSTTTSGYICTKYQVDPNNMSYSARFVVFPGSAVPAWGTTAET